MSEGDGLIGFGGAVAVAVEDVSRDDFGRGKGEGGEDEEVGEGELHCDGG